jgi:hypothetical protein
MSNFNSKTTIALIAVIAAVTIGMLVASPAFALTVNGNANGGAGGASNSGSGGSGGSFCGGSGGSATGGTGGAGGAGTC